ncbi:hypothetical protein Ato02nite_074930 [Paractinoplanes toevensis]|uniref:Uncharacterized protein n=1 Tax=Paractinoplanes toevensis TaxID=571911 RepID=A0A919THM3_9ACTN|nr:hypothetical protein Ato02nite_074930 [Actinoplanes toevensis]
MAGQTPDHCISRRFTGGSCLRSDAANAEPRLLIAAGYQAGLPAPAARRPTTQPPNSTRQHQTGGG